MCSTQVITQQEVMWYGLTTELGLRLTKYDIVVAVMAHGAMQFIIEILLL